MLEYRVQCDIHHLRSWMVARMRHDAYVDKMHDTIEHIIKRVVQLEEQGRVEEATRLGESLSKVMGDMIEYMENA
jgi:hypothetical protein